MSGYAAVLLEKRRFMEGEIDFLPRPISPKDLLAKIREVLER